MPNKLIEKPIKVSKDHYLLKIETNKNYKPGQFINIKVNSQNDPLLRRPFSLFDYSNNILEVIIQTVGKGTKFIRDYAKVGDIDILGPLGNGFSLVENKKVLIIGGGVGNAPLYFLSKELKKLNCNVTYIYGSRNKEYIYEQNKFESAVDKFILTTDDGSSGQKGFVTDAAEELLKSENYDNLYTCGPTPMMEAVMKVFSSTNITCEASLENYFGCGIGVCSGCTVQTTNGQKRACIDGPVFDGKELIWDSIAD